MGQKPKFFRKSILMAPLSFFSFSQSFVAQLEDSFIRTQDDSMYVQGRGVRRVVFWNDVNGVPFLLTKVGEPSMEDHDIVVEDCTVGVPPCPLLKDSPFFAGQVVYSRRWLPPCFGGQVL